ncbi:MAG: AraC family transcriptional regulator [Hydrocarboniphaga sp.]|uniref:helix-turn-helix domain-containing protein n=1 Tax=Hydrocarboniphaga sp. TaxID=2033016 RepID=UPI00260DC777|nr:helix-turn-helix domain-containing protein [Hydrocarboniphaga sp.]MDB5971505.1 AraC family transcriptional regulator [Hydrocarboniphaga sp.]
MTSSATRPRFRPIALEQYGDISKLVCSMRYEMSDPSASFPTSFRGCQIGAVNLTRYESQGLEHGVRTPEHVRANPVDSFILCMPLHARFQIDHAGLCSEFSAGSAVLLTAQRPFEAYVSGSSTDGRHSSIQVRVPGSLLRSHAPQVDQLCNRAFPLSTSAGSMLRTTLMALLQRASGLTPIQGQHHGRALTHLIAGCFDDIEGKEAFLREDAVSTDAVFDRAMLFIECYLSASNLDTELVANHCHVSSRYLHTIFARRSLSVSGHIRESRLQQCRRALHDPAMAHQSIIEIACRWGFVDPSHFGRAYRRRFGIAPSEERASGRALAFN